MRKLVEDLSALTNVPINTLSNMVELSRKNIAHCVYESVMEHRAITEINIGVGILYIKYEGDEVTYKFVPSKLLEKEVIQTISTRSSPLVESIETSIRSKIENTYKELI